jgi:hypothetical protein
VQQLEGLFTSMLWIHTICIRPSCRLHVQTNALSLVMLLLAY